MLYVIVRPERRWAGALGRVTIRGKLAGSNMDGSLLFFHLVSLSAK